MINLNDIVKENQLNTDMTELTKQQTNCIIGGRCVFRGGKPEGSDCRLDDIQRLTIFGIKNPKNPVIGFRK
jgi:hypothetical protein